MGSAEGVGVGWADGEGVGSDGDAELDGDGVTWALAAEPGHVASDNTSVANASPIRTLVATPPLRFFIVPQTLPPGVTPGERLLNAWCQPSPDADRRGPWRRVRDPAP